jgi:exopolysaccharide biosynthesis WecB/TagA/CpsF family protein
MRSAVEKVRHAAHSKTRCVIATPNLNFVISAQTDAEFRDSVIGSDLCLADGMPLVWMARLLKLPIPERVAGSELFDRLLAHAGPPVTVYFFGGPAGAGKAAAAALERAAGGLRCVGYEEAPFAPVEALSGDDTIERINRSGADFVIVALGARKGQAWIERNRSRLTGAGALSSRGRSSTLQPARSRARRASCRCSGSSGCGASRKSRRCGAAIRTMAWSSSRCCAATSCPGRGACVSAPMRGASPTRRHSRRCASRDDAVVAEGRVDACRPRAAARRVDVRGA